MKMNLYNDKVVEYKNKKTLNGLQTCINISYYMLRIFILINLYINYNNIL